MAISARQIQNYGVRTAAATEGRLDTGFSAPGVVGLDERTLVAVQARSQGYVERLHVRAQYDSVAAGQPLADLYVPEWLAAEEEWLALRASTQPSAAQLADAARARLRLYGVPEAEIARVERDGTASARVTVTAPQAGIVWEIGARDGMAIMPGVTLFKLAGIGTVWVTADVPEAQAEQVRVGAPVEARTAAYPQHVFKGSVNALLPEINAQTRSVRARIVLANPGGTLKPGMFATVLFGGVAPGSSVLVPAEAVIQTGSRSVVLVDAGGGRFVPRDVETGRRSGDVVEIRKGVDVGQRVVVSGQFLVDSEANLRAALARMATEDSKGAPATAPADTAASSTPAKPAVYKAEGVVRAVGNEILIRHGDLPGSGNGRDDDGVRATAGRRARERAAGNARHLRIHDDAGWRRADRLDRAGQGTAQMIAALIRWSVANRFLVLLAAVLVAAVGVWAVRTTPLDAIPDLSDTQVIIRTTFPGQAPQIVEDQVTFPLTTTMLSVPGAKAVRGYSFFGDSFVYVLFEDGTDQYWARSRVLEYLNQVQGRLPAAAKPALGPDATGVGWIFEYALVDRVGGHDLAQLRALQDWFLKYELKALPNVAEVATVGGMVRQYQVVVDPARLKAYNLPLTRVIAAIRGANQEAGGSVVELAEAEYMVRTRGYLRSLEDFRAVPVQVSEGGTPVLLRDVARVQLGPEMRRGIAELDGEGEVVGGIVVMRSGKNAWETIQAVKARLEQLKPGLPRGVEIVTVYDRSALIERAVEHLRGKLVEEFAVVALVCLAFLVHLRSALVAVVSLPLGVLAAFIVMRAQGVNANIMSLGGIAIAIGAMVDAAIVMVENAHKKLEAWKREHGGEPSSDEHWQVIAAASTEVGPALFFSLLVITLSFVPVFTLEAQEGRLFAPLAYTKTYAMAAAAGLAVTLVPVLMGYFVRGRIPSEAANPLNRWLIAGYRPVLGAALAWPKATLVAAALALAVTAWPVLELGGEFMPPMDEGDLLYMPTALPGLSAGKAGELLQQTDRLIRTVPEVARVFGKVGRAETATDPAPMEMIETTIQFKPKSAWRPEMTTAKLIDELDRTVQVPGLSNVWVPPIRNRIDMLATGIKSPVGVKVSGPDLAEIDRVTQAIERAVRGVPGVTSALAERLEGGRYLDVAIDRGAAARYGLNVADVQDMIGAAVGGENIGETVEGLARFPISVRYPREYRDSLETLKMLPVVTERGAQLPLSAVASVRIVDGPPMLKSENARLSGWVYVDVRGRDLVSVVRDAKLAVARDVALPPGYSVSWAGQFEYLERAKARLAYVVPATLAVIFVLLYLAFRRIDEALLIMLAVPFALIGGYWLLWALGYATSVATAVGFIALAGVAAEFGVVMLLYLRHAWEGRLARNEPATRATLIAAIEEGAVLRVRPKAMTVAVIMAGLLPIMLSEGTGAEIMQRIAAPMVGGMVTAPLLSMLVIPAAYLLLRGRGLALTSLPSVRTATPARARAAAARPRRARAPAA